LGRFHGKLKGEFLEDTPAEAVDNHEMGVLDGQAPLLAVEELVVADF